MRRPRHKLQVSTFPFLAVLLGAMGALILLLLVMDRRSKIVARNKALEIHSQLLARRTKSDDLRREEEEARRADWQRKCQEIHDLLVEQERELAREHDEVQRKWVTLNHELGNEDKMLSELERGVVAQRARLDLKNQLLSQMRQGIARSKKLNDGTNQEVEKLARELATLERALQEAKALKLQKQETYSLVPYRAKRGEGRRPVYVECTADALVFHPEGQRLEGRDFSTARFRADVERRGVALVRAQHDPERPNRPPAPPPTSPYVLFLVRPDGLESYYGATGALRGFDLDFGYEFVDADWVFDFAQAPRLAGQPAPLPRETPRSSAPPPLPDGRVASIGYPAQGDASGVGNAKGMAGGTASGGNLRALDSTTAGNGNGSGPGGQPRGSLGGGDATFGASPGQAGTGRLPRLGPVIENSANDIANGAGTPGFGGQFPIAAAPGPLTGTNYDNPSANGRAAGSTPGSGAVGANAVGPAKATGSQATTDKTASQDVSWRGTPGATQNSIGSVSGSAVAPGTNAPDSGNQTQAHSKDGPGADTGPTDPLARLAPPPLFDIPRTPNKKAGLPPSLGRLLANRDYVLTVECFNNVIALYPSSQVFSVADGPQQDSIDAAMVQAVQQLIARRQATVRGGEAPYRPLLRFQVHPDALRTYFHVYPLFEGLHIPMARENLPG